MKMLLAAFFLVTSVSAFAQKHMVQVGTDNTTIGNLTWTSEKSRGSNSTESKNHYVFANYAMSLTDHIQAGAKINYSKFKDSSFGSSESYGLQVGGVYNLNTDFKKSLYASLYVGWDWGRETQPNSSSEVFKTTLAVGHRYPLSFISENVTYSPEIAFVSSNPTKSSQTEWSQGLEFRLIQFAVFF